jgi:hypothetical protein
MLAKTWQRVHYMVRLWNIGLLVLGLVGNLLKQKVVREGRVLQRPKTQIHCLAVSRRRCGC